MTAKEVEMWDMLYEIQRKCRNYEECKVCPFHITHKFSSPIIACPIGKPYLDWELPQRAEKMEEAEE